MNRAIAVFLTFLFLVLASLFFLWLRPVALPKPLTPVADWFDERKAALGQSGKSASDDTNNRLEGALSEQGRAMKAEPIDLAASRSGVAQVTVDKRGNTSVVAANSANTALASDSMENTAPNPTRSPVNAQAKAKTSDPTTSASSTVGTATATANAATLPTATQTATPAPAANVSASTSSASGAASVTKSDNGTSASLAAVVNDQRKPDSAANRATTALAAATEQVTRRLQAQEHVVATTATASTSKPAPNTPPTASITPASNNTAIEPALANQSKKAIAPVAVLTPEIKAKPPVTAAAVRQQQTIANYLEGRRVEFELGRDRLTARGVRVLDRLVPIIKANAGTIITIQGHTDDVGDTSSNLELSGARAVAARAYLISQGISARRLNVQGMGERFPIADNHSEAGRVRNRRIDFAVSDAS